MCKAIDDMLKESWDEGFEEGQKIAKESKRENSLFRSRSETFEKGNKDCVASFFVSAQ